MPLVSIVIPSYNEQEVLALCVSEMSRVAGLISAAEFEFIFVDDGSADGTLALIKQAHEADSRVRYVSFSRNFGKEAALLAGLRAARGDYVAVLDADLQDPPELLVEMYRIITEEPYDCVAALRSSRTGESPIRSFFATRFYDLFNAVSSTSLVSGARDYRLMSRRMVDAILQLSEVNRFSKGIFSWVGFETKWLEYENVERAAGTTKWSFMGLVRYSLEGFLGFSAAPLALASALGFAFCLIAFVWIIFIIGRTILHNTAVAGWPSLACIVLFASGVQLFTIGILGQYLARTYMETKHRPVYIVRETEE